MTRIQLLCVYCTLIGAVSSAVASDGISLKVSISGLKPQTGQVMVSLYDSKKNFLRQPLETIRRPVEDSGNLGVEFEGVVPGVYAVGVIYDLDNDGELDTGMFRIPSEPIGISNNVRSRFGPPKWKKAKFELQGDMQMEIEVADAID